MYVSIVLAGNGANSGFLLALAATAFLGFSLVSLVHDKAAHFTAFCVLTFLFYWLVDFGQLFFRLVASTFVVCTVGASVSLEWMQEFINPRRIFDTRDILFNAFGSLCGLLGAVALQLYKANSRMEPYEALEMEQV